MKAGKRRQQSEASFATFDSIFESGGILRTLPLAYPLLRLATLWLLLIFFLADRTRISVFVT